MRARCPKNHKHNRFTTTAHEVHDWVVDEEGEFVKDLGCSEVDEGPDTENVWTCYICGAEAVIEYEDE